VLCLASALAQAGAISVTSAHLVAGEEAYSVVADIALDFNSRLEEAINKGVVLYFTADFELTRGRWYWFDEQLVRRSKSFQLSYHALTRQYRLSTGALPQSFGSLDEALRVLTRLRNWQVFDKSEVRVDQTYSAALRMRLDLSQMPKTFQVSALANRDWNLSSPWARWTFTPKDETSVPAAAAPTPALPSPASPVSAPVEPAEAPSPPPAPASGDAK
jgi:hypothetical protein